MIYDDDVYNEKYLDDEWKNYLKGFKSGLVCFETFLNNLDCYVGATDYENEDGFYDEKANNNADIFLLKLINNDFNKQVLLDCFKEWHKNESEEIIMSGIDSLEMSDEDWEKWKREKDGEKE